MCSTMNLIWKCSCPRMIFLFNWLAWDNNIVTPENLVAKRCNRLSTHTCVPSREAIELADHLFIRWPFVERI